MGFSTYTPQPSYQADAVKAYLNSGVTLPPSTYYNSSNRGYPDVAALGNGFLVYLNSYGGWTTVGGTSASSPTFTGAAAHPSAFTDITSGDNKCTESGCFSTCKGYEATTGWDPVTGLGSPVASEMLKYLESTLTSDVSV